ncbi:acetyl-CoA carboxylase biotin carboxylase subunit [Thalassobius vesicularis]|uniref:Acetyl-CoA carboxylase biotin carboxylase subunit n=1 Tax=Thalassobius vesicularis TaxID=1294297 RepID=A0A4V3UZ61_9RHOB|nr:acetyl-CoA carboxylase biotin carboxylase subunit [Thalassobius vesicularis]THD75042.1 acetyl-CoA carboxylase biotin carboxylase subunit [Thalassobius vesicularis]
MAINKLLIANRGEIAVRIIKTARRMGIATVAVHSEADAEALHVRMADQSVCIGGAAPASSYLRIDRIIEAAQQTGADAIHPGYGFLAENENLPAACQAAGLTFVGPSAEAIRAMGDKAAAKALMQQAGVPCVPGFQGDQTPETLADEATKIGYPVMIKATAGGGGRGMRLVAEAGDFADALRSAKSEAKAAFGDDTVLLEKAIVSPRHIEIQVMADSFGTAVHLGERDCSVQRRHQKVIEEAPSPAVSAELRAEMGAAALRAVSAIGYEGAGTLEFLLDGAGHYYFMEMNTRLQVEHPVTEAITGLDLVELQLRVAGGQALGLTQDDITFDGHAIEVRLCAEDPDAGFMPQSGRMLRWTPPTALRCDHALTDGAMIPPYYDSMVAKLIAHAPTRDEARQALIRGLGQTRALGVRTNQGFLADCLGHPVFAAGEATTSFIGAHEDELFSGADEAKAAEIAAVLGRATHCALTHGFPTPVLLKRGEATHDMRLLSRPQGLCQIEHGDDRTELTVAPRGILRDGIQEEADLLRCGDAVWLHWNGRAWDFEDRSLAPRMAGKEGGDGKVRASMNGRVVALLVAPGDHVAEGQKVLVLEAMKMEHTHKSAVAGVVQAVHAVEGDQVEAHRILVEVTPNE